VKIKRFVLGRMIPAILGETVGAVSRRDAWVLEPSEPKSDAALSISVLDERHDGGLKRASVALIGEAVSIGCANGGPITEILLRNDGAGKVTLVFR